MNGHTLRAGTAEAVKRVDAERRQDHRPQQGQRAAGRPSPPFEPPSRLAQFGRTLVLVPHPDDETIGCGGVLALLGRAGAAVQVVLVTEGDGSHRHSRDYPALQLRALRRREIEAALRELGHGPRCLVSLGLPDGAVPAASEPGFEALVKRLARITRHFQPDTVLMPTHDDAHPDHRATCAAGAAACRLAAPDACRLEYPVWPGETREREAVQFDITAALADKQRALAQHRSQLGLVVQDDPHGFILPPELLARCALPVETFFYGQKEPPETIDRR